MSNAKCCKCKTDFDLPDALWEAAMRSDEISFWCPYGHEQHFTQPNVMTEEPKAAVLKLVPKDSAWPDLRSHTGSRP